MSVYGKKLNPKRMPRVPRALKGERKEIVITHTPSTVLPGQELIVKFPSLGVNDVIVPGSVRLAFNLELDGGSDVNRTIYNNLSRNLISKIQVALQGNEFISYTFADVFHNFKDNWLYEKVVKNETYRGLEKANVAKLRVGAANADNSANNGKDKALADAFGNRYAIPLDIDIFTTHEPFYPSSLRAPLTYILTFNSADKVVDSTDTEASYTLTGLSLEYEIVTSQSLAQTIKNQRKGDSYYLFDRIHMFEHRHVNKNDTLWNVSIAQPIRSLRGILFLWKDPSVKNPQRFYNPRVKKTMITVDGMPNQLYSKGMETYQHWNEVKKFFGDTDAEHAQRVARDLNNYGVEIEDYYKDKYGLWLDFRSNDDNILHGSGRTIKNHGGINIELNRDAESAGDLSMYVFLIMDAQLKLEDGSFSSLTS